MNVVPWLERYFKPVGSAKSVDFDIGLTPMLAAPIEHVNDGVTQEVDVIAPVQSGKSAAGEGVLLWYLAHSNRGDASYFWQSDEAADQRWLKHFERKIRACAPVMAKLPKDRYKFQKGLVAFPALNFVMQGAFSDRTVASDSFRIEILEEVHDQAGGWAPGRVAQCFGRTTGFWDRLIYIISNAGLIGSELHQHFTDGTQEHWQVKCLQCKDYHTMHAEKTADGSGLVYDDWEPNELGRVDYAKLAPSIRYRFECGHEIVDNLATRRSLALSGRYSDPRPGADLRHRSYTYEAVSCPDIPFLSLVKEKQAAHHARKRGDPRPWRIYLRERESKFIPAVDRPEAKALVLSTGTRKNREGWPDRVARLAAADYQEGKEGEPQHWWLVIRDFKADGASVLVYEGKCVDQAELVGTLSSHGVLPLDVTLDASYSPKEIVYPLALSRGYCCIKVEGERSGVPAVYKHSDESTHAWSEPQLLYVVMGVGPSQSNPALEPRFWHLSKHGAMEALAWLRASEIPWLVPEDVSEDYKAHMAAWTYTTRKLAVTGETVPLWKVASERADDHLFQCECYIAISASMERIIGVGKLPEKPEAVPA